MEYGVTFNWTLDVFLRPIFFVVDHADNTAIKSIIDWLFENISYNMVTWLAIGSAICLTFRLGRYSELGDSISKEGEIFNLFEILLMSNTYTLGVIPTLFLGFLSGLFLLLFVYFIFKR